MGKGLVRDQSGRDGTGSSTVRKKDERTRWTFFGVKLVFKCDLEMTIPHLWSLITSKW